MAWLVFMAAIIFNIYSIIFYAFFPHKVKRKINVENLCDRGNSKDKFYNSSLIYNDAERVCYHMVDCCQKAIADEYDRVFWGWFFLKL